MKIYRTYSRGRDAVLHRGDCLDLLRSLPDQCVNLTVTSPPYSMGKEYETSRSVEDFVSAHARLLPEIVRVTAPGGSICWQVGYHVRERVTTPLDYHVHEILSRFAEMKLRNRIIWTFGHGLHETARFSGRHEVILWYSKGDSYGFDLDAVRVPQKYPGKTAYKGPRKGRLSGNPSGKNPSDVWDVPNVNANHSEKTSHPCQFPMGLPLRLVRALTKRGHLILDPFAGSGTTAAAALLEGRRFVGAELMAEYADIAEERMRLAATATLRYREPDEPLYVPPENAKVAIRPQGFR